MELITVNAKYLWHSGQPPPEEWSTSFSGWKRLVLQRIKNRPQKYFLSFTVWNLQRSINFGEQCVRELLSGPGVSKKWASKSLFYALKNRMLRYSVLWAGKYRFSSVFSHVYSVFCILSVIPMILTFCDIWNVCVGKQSVSIPMFWNRVESERFIPAKTASSDQKTKDHYWNLQRWPVCDRSKRVRRWVDLDHTL